MPIDFFNDYSNPIVVAELYNTSADFFIEILKTCGYSAYAITNTPTTKKIYCRVENFNDEMCVSRMVYTYITTLEEGRKSKKDAE